MTAAQYADLLWLEVLVFVVAYAVGRILNDRLSRRERWWQCPHCLGTGRTPMVGIIPEAALDELVLERKYGYTPSEPQEAPNPLPWTVRAGEQSEGPKTPPIPRDC